MFFTEPAKCEYCNSTTTATGAGKVCCLNVTHSCPGGCFCPGGETFYTAQTIGKVESICGANAGYGTQVTDGGAWRCPSSYPNSDAGASSIGNCYAVCDTGRKAYYVGNISCAAGNYLPATAQACQACKKGNKCSGGTYSISCSDQGIKECSKGTYSSTTGASSCKKCSTGLYSTSSGATNCAKAQDGQCVTKISKQCIGGTSTGATGVMNCTGTAAYSNENHTECTACENAGYYIDGRVCKKCPVPTGNYEFKTRAGDDRNTLGIRACIVQPKLQGTGCGEASTIYYRYDGQKQNYVKEGGEILPNAQYNSYVKEQYADGSLFTDIKQGDLCALCPANTFTSDDNYTGEEACQICPQGSCYSGSGQTSQCHLCSIGYECPEENKRCDIAGNKVFGQNACPAGTVASSEGRVSCSACSPGYTAVDGKKCEQKTIKWCKTASECATAQNCIQNCQGATVCLKTCESEYFWSWPTNLTLKTIQSPISNAE